MKYMYFSKRGHNRIAGVLQARTIMEALNNAKWECVLRRADYKGILIKQI